MREAARRTDSWIVSGRVVVALALAIVAVVAIVVAGVREQNRRQIPSAHSVSIWSAVASSVEVGPVGFGPVTAQALAATVNHLGRMPDWSRGPNCSSTGRHYRLAFATVSGEVDVRDNVTGCGGVSISSHGSDWGAHKWDPDNRLADAIRADLASSNRR